MSKMLTSKWSGEIHAIIRLTTSHGKALDSWLGLTNSGHLTHYVCE